MMVIEKALKDLVAYMDDGDENHFKDWEEPTPSEHGKVVDYRCEAFYDVTVYEDGYEDRYYVGD